MKNYIVASILVLLSVNSYSQSFSNSVKGVVKDAFTDEILVNATITLTVDSLNFSTISDSEGKFILKKSEREGFACKSTIWATSPISRTT